MIRLTLLIAVTFVSMTGLVSAEDVRVEKDVPYLGPDRKEKLDLYFPARIDDGDRLPAVVIIHGGGWTGGDKGARREQNIGTNLAKVGYVCASINYVLAPDGADHMANRIRPVWPQNLHDCKTAVRYLRKNADEFHVDPDHIGVIGGSAGGHLTAMVGLTQPKDGLDPQGPYGEFSCQVQAIVPLYGAHDLIVRCRTKGELDRMTEEDRALCRAASPVTYASQDDPPSLILHGTADTTVAVEQSELLYKSLEKVGATTQLEIIEGAPHSFHLQPKQRDLRPLAIGFFDRHLKPKQ